MCGPEPKETCETEHACVEPHRCDGYTCSECGWSCPTGGPAGMDSDPPLVPAALPLAEVRATMRALRSYLPELYPTARMLLEVGINHVEAACDEMEHTPACLAGEEKCH